MQLKEFALINPSVEAKEVFQAIQTVSAPEAINQALERSDRFEKRQRKLPDVRKVRYILIFKIK